MENHARNVRFLYKTCLKLHRGLPHEMRSIGDAYVKEEFKRHINAQPEHVGAFMEAWTNYALTLSKQLSVKGIKSHGPVGQSLGEKELNLFSEAQIMQLHELYKESTKPI